MDLHDDSFSKKRRNLIFVSSLLLFLKFADAEVQSSTSISVLKFTIGNPQAITQAIWAVWLYCLVRAYQHFSYYMRNDYYRARQRTVAPLMHPYISGCGVPLEREMFLFEDMERFHKYDLSFRPQFIVEGICKDWQDLKKVFRARVPRIAGSRKINLVRYPAGHFRRKWSRSGPSDAWRVSVWTITDRSIVGAGKNPVEMVAEVGLGFLSGLALRTRILAALIFTSAPFFEVRLPFVYAIAPVLAYFYQPMASRFLGFF